MIWSIETTSSDWYIIDGSRHAPEGWIPARIEKHGDIYEIYDREDFLRAEINSRHVVSTIRKKGDKNEHHVTLND